MTKTAQRREDGCSKTTVGSSVLRCRSERFFIIKRSALVEREDEQTRLPLYAKHGRVNALLKRFQATLPPSLSHSLCLSH